MPRFTGQTKKFYSVGQHSVIVSLQATSAAQPLKWLLHGCPLRLTCVIFAPRLKHSGKFEEYAGIEKVIQEAIYSAISEVFKGPASTLTRG